MKVMRKVYEIVLKYVSRGSPRLPGMPAPPSAPRLSRSHRSHAGAGCARSGDCLTAAERVDAA